MHTIDLADEEFVQEETLIPPVPETIEETGLAASLVEQLILKMLYFRGEVLGRDLAKALGFKFSLIDSLMEYLKRHHLVEVKHSTGMGHVTARFVLTEAGRNQVREYLDTNQYTGPAPVPLFQYTEIVRRQRQRDGWLTKAALASAYGRMVVPARVLAQIGPAVSSGNSLLIYGKPGNGKTFLAEALMNLETSYIFVPYAIEFQGMIIQVYDPVHHHRIEDEELSGSAIAFESPCDGRWFKCRRPFIITGGELTLDMLDLSYNLTSKVYDAPFQLKANNGIYLIDDFGRQRVTPAEVLNRWIVPMERRVDYLSFRSGGKMSIPFEAFLIFSTNLQPEQLGDEAFLRRIQYKMLLRSPEELEFVEIFDRYCASKNLPYAPQLVSQFIDKHYRETSKPFRRCQPRDVISHAIDVIHFEKLPYMLTHEVLDQAFDSCFLEESEAAG